MNSNIILYQTSNVKTKIDVQLENEKVWLNRQQMTALFNRNIKAIGKHINNILQRYLQLRKNESILKVTIFYLYRNDNKGKPKKIRQVWE